MRRPVVLFVNQRRTPLEVNAALYAAHAAGYRVALLADRPPVSGDGLIEEVEIVDTYDRARALKAGIALARRVRPAGVATWSDRDVELTAALARELGLPGLDPDAAHRARNKAAMRAALAHEPEVAPRFAAVRTREDLSDAAEEIGYPAVLKPAGGAASKGIFEIESEADLDDAFASLSAYVDPAVDPMFGDYPGELVYEELMEGSEHSVEGFVHDGEVLVAGVTDAWTTFPFHAEYQHVHPSGLAPEARDAVERLTNTVVRALGFDWCTFHLECRVQPDGRAKFGEVAARIGGNYITSHLVPLSTGLPFYEGVVRVACGERPDVRPRSQLAAGVRYVLAREEGRFERLDGLAEILALPGIEHFVWEAPPGSEVVLPPHDFISQLLGVVIARGATQAEVKDVLARAAETAEPRIGAARALAAAEATDG